jgi:hypothetical protein
MPGKHQYWLQKTRVVATVGAAAIILILYGLRHVFG